MAARSHLQIGQWTKKLRSTGQGREKCLLLRRQLPPTAKMNANPATVESQDVSSSIVSASQRRNFAMGANVSIAKTIQSIVKFVEGRSGRQRIKIRMHSRRRSGPPSTTMGVHAKSRVVSRNIVSVSKMESYVLPNASAPIARIMKDLLLWQIVAER